MNHDYAHLDEEIEFLSMVKVFGPRNVEWRVRRAGSNKAPWTSASYYRPSFKSAIDYEFRSTLYIQE